MKDSTVDDHPLLSIDAVLAQLNTHLHAVSEQEWIAITHALNRVLAEDIHSRINVPPHDYSAMDGYALHGSDLPLTGETQLTLVGQSQAGKPYISTVQSGQCVRIFTGAVMPLGTDTVVMQEDVEINDHFVTISAGQQPKQHVRLKGEDAVIGQVILKAGKRLLPADIGLLASQGIPKIVVTRRLRVTFFSTGDELCSIDQIPHSGQIYDSNRYLLYSMLTRLGGITLDDQGIVKDNREAIKNILLKSAAQSDVIIASGGVSVGDADYVVEVLKQIGKVYFWKMAVKPGKPLIFGKIQNAAFFGLPGNPVSVMNTFYQVVQPALQQLMGQLQVVPLRFKVRCATVLEKQAGRMEFQRGILEKTVEGDWVVRPTAQQNSGALSSMSQANCFIILPLECEFVEKNSEVWVEPFEGLF
jgi:molybdopterin molybdotransferase